MREMRAELADVLGLYSTVSLNSITPSTGSINTKKAYKEFCKSLYEIGVTAEMVRRKKREILLLFKPHDTNSSQTGEGTVKDRDQSVGTGACSSAETPSISIDRKQTWNQFGFFGWVRPPIDFLVGPLMLAAAQAGDTKRLISTLEYIRNINFEDDWKETALHKAAYKGYNDIVQLLLTKGASIEARNEDNYTPLHHAARNGHTSTVDLLLTKHASIEATGKDAETPLHFAACSGYTDIVELLVDQGASIEARSIYNYTPLYLAARNGHTATSQERYFD